MKPGPLDVPPGGMLPSAVDSLERRFISYPPMSFGAMCAASVIDSVRGCKERELLLRLQKMGWPEDLALAAVAEVVLLGLAYGDTSDQEPGVIRYWSADDDY